MLEIVYYKMNNCSFCQQAEPAINALASSNVQLTTINYSETPDLLPDYVNSFPTLILKVDDVEVSYIDDVLGALGDGTIDSLIEQYAPTTTPTTTDNPSVAQGTSVMIALGLAALYFVFKK